MAGWIILLLFLPERLVAQMPENWQENWLEDGAEAAEDESQQSEILEEYLLLQAEYRLRKLDLNRADEHTLLQSGLFSTYEVAALLAHRQKYGNLVDWFELQAIAGFTPERLKTLSEFCGMSPGHVQGSLLNSFTNAKHKLLWRNRRVLQSQAGYDKNRAAAGLSHYAGSPLSWLLQYRQSGSRHSMALSASKDPGEQGIDRLGGHLQIKSSGRLEKLILGDYHLQLGHGLLASTSFAAGRSGGIAGTYQSGSGLQGASGNQAFGVFRGIAAKYRLNKEFSILPWAFSMRWSASLENAFEDGPSAVLSIQQSGRFRTPNEIERRNNLLVNGGGMQLSRHRGPLRMQWQSQWLRLGLPLSPKDAPYQAYVPVGSSFVHHSFSHQWHRHRWQQFGEVALFQHRTVATVQHLLLTASNQLQLQWTYRHYPPAYHSFFANALRVGSQVTNESGLFSQVSFQPNRKQQFDYFLDLWQHPWLRYRVHGPSTGLEQRLQWQFHPQKNARFTLRMRHTQRSRNAGNLPIQMPMPYEQWRLMLQWQQQIDEQWWVQFRTDQHTWSQQGESHWSQHFGIRLKWQYQAWRISFQRSQFDATHFDNRFYVQEPDLLYATALSMLNGQGTRNTVLIQYKARRGLDFWLVYAHQHFRDRNAVGSGLESSNGNLRSEIKFQCQYRF